MITDYARLVIEADSRSVKTASADLDNLSATSTKTTTTVTSLLRTLGGLAAAYGAVGAARAAIRTTADFQQQIANLSAITGATGKDLEFYAEQAALIGRTTSLSASQAAEAFKLIASAKPDLLSSADALTAVTREAVTLAEATGESLPAAAAALGAALNQFQLPASEASRVINALAASSQLGTAEVGAVTEAMRNAGAAANSLGLDFEETVAGIQALAASGRQGADAGTALRQVLLRLEKTADETLQPSIVGLDKALQELATRNLDNTQLMDLFGQQSFTAAASLLAQKDVVTDLNVSLRGTSTAYEQASTRMDTFNGDVLGLRSAIEGLQISAMSDDVDGLGRSLVQTATGGVNFLTENMDALKSVVQVMTVLVGTRLAAAVLTASSAKVTAAASSAAYQIALARMAGLSTTAAAGQTALALATTTANRAMALIGGPAGVAILAAFAIFKLVTAIKDKREAAIDATDATERLADAMRNYGDENLLTNATIDGARERIRQISLEMNQAIAVFGAGSDEVNALTEEMDDLGRQITRLQSELKQGTSATEDITDAIDDASSATDSMSGAIAELTPIVKGSTTALDEKRAAVQRVREETARQQKATDDLISSLFDEINALDMSSLEIAIQTAQRKAGTNATAEELQGIEAMISVLHKERETRADNAAAVEIWTKAATNGARQRAAAEVESARVQREMLQKTHEFMTSTLIDIFNNSDNVFKKIGDSFVAMVKRMVAEWAASKLMNLVGMGGPQVANPFSALASSTAGQAVKSAIGIGGGSAGGAGGALAGAGSAVLGGAKAAGAAVVGGAKAAGSAAMGFAAANPLLAGVAAAAVVAKALETKPTLSSNAGILIHDAPGASADRKFAVNPFDSGFSPIGFARREDQSAANEVIDVFRRYDASLTEIARAAGLSVNYSNNPFGGFDEKGQGSGLFLGTAAEEGKGVTSASMDQQLTQFTKQWVEALGGQVSPADRAFLLSAGSADELMERAAELGQGEMGRIHGSHYNGLDRVPFDGYMAQLHQGERVLTASEADAMDRMGMGDLVSIMKAIAQHTSKTARQLERWDFLGLPEERVFT